MISFLTHPVTTFFGGGSSRPHRDWDSPEHEDGSLTKAAQFVRGLPRSDDQGRRIRTVRQAPLQRLCSHPTLYRIPQKRRRSGSIVEDQTANVYAEGAYLDDTIATHYGPAEIQSVTSSKRQKP